MAIYFMPRLEAGNGERILFWEDVWMYGEGTNHRDQNSLIFIESSQRKT